MKSNKSGININHVYFMCILILISIIVVYGCGFSASGKEEKNTETTIEQIIGMESETASISGSENATEPETEPANEDNLKQNSLSDDTKGLIVVKESASQMLNTAQENSLITSNGTTEPTTEQTTEPTTEQTTEQTTEPTTEPETQPQKPQLPEIIRTSGLTSEVVPYDGLVRAVSFWGDSLTEGFGTSDQITIEGINAPTMPSTVGAKTGLQVFNLGIYGELSRDIACRQGGLKMYVSNLVIQASGITKIDKIMCEDGNQLGFGTQGAGNGLAWHACFDECTIAGVKGKLELQQDGSYNFTRAESGIAVSVIDPEQIFTPQYDARKNDILVIQMGNNGGWNEDINTLIEQYDSMILHSNYRYYIIIADTDYDSQYYGDYIWEASLEAAYGEHFLNMRKYLSDVERFNDSGLVPTKQDLDMISVGEVPASFKLEDMSHLTAYGYWLEGIAVYKKGLELGYWK